MIRFPKPASLIEKLAKKGLSQIDIATGTGMLEATVSRIRSGKTQNIDLDAYERLVNFAVCEGVNVRLT